MNPRFQGFGKALILVPILSYIPLRTLVGDFEESHHALVVSLSLLVSGVLTLAIAVAHDKKAGIDVFSREAWTSGLMGSQHIFLYLPIRVVGAILLTASIGVLFL